MKNLSKVAMAMILAISMVAGVSAAGTSTGDVSVTITSPNAGENVSVSSWGGSLPVEYELQNTNVDKNTVGNVTLDLTDSSSNTENYDLKTDYNLSSDTTDTLSYNVDNFGALEWEEDWTATVDFVTEDSYTVSDSVTFYAHYENVTGIIFNVVQLMIVFLLVFKIVAKVDDI